MVRVLMPSALPLMMLLGWRSMIIVHLGKLRQLSCQTQTRWASARNQHIHFFRQWLIGATVAAVRGGLFDVGVATAKTVFVKLHVLSPLLKCLRNLGMDK